MIFSFLYRGLRKVNIEFFRVWSNAYTKVKLAGNNVEFGNCLKSNGIPVVRIATDGKCQIGKGFKMNSGIHFNPIGRNQPCYLVVGSRAELVIGNNVGISSTALVAYAKIHIGNNVKIGGNTVIFDTDFHSLDYLERRDRSLDFKNAKKLPVVIEDDAFIGAHVTILKGVTVGKGAIVATGSVVAKNVPRYEIWGGNPAKFIKKTGLIE